MSTCVILQSSYLPWRGYFDLIRRADVFVFLDDVQFTRRDWRTRNFIKQHTGRLMLSVPIHAHDHFHRKINEVTIDKSVPWPRRHLRSIAQCYAKAPHVDVIYKAIEPLYEPLPDLLVDLNRKLIKTCWNLLTNDAPKLFLGSETIDVGARGGTERLAYIARAVGADHYLSGPSASAYIEPSVLQRYGVTLEYHTYDYHPYQQQGVGFEPSVSALDVLMNLGVGSLETAVASPPKIQLASA